MDREKSKTADTAAEGFAKESSLQSYPDPVIRTALAPEKIIQRIKEHDLSFRELLRQIEIAVVEAALEHNNYNEFKTAKYLRMDRNTLRRVRTRARNHDRAARDRY